MSMGFMLKRYDTSKNFAINCPRNHVELPYDSLACDGRKSSTDDDTTRKESQDFKSP